MPNTPYLYGKLNKEIESLHYRFSSSDNSISISQIDGEEFNLDLTSNIQNLITLKQVEKDSLDPNGPIKYYALYGYNSNTKQFDIKLGDEIVVNNFITNTNTNNIDTVWIKIGEQQRYDEKGNPMFEEDGITPVIVPILQEVPVSVSQTGQLILGPNINNI